LNLFIKSKLICEKCTISIEEVLYSYEEEEYLLDEVDNIPAVKKSIKPEVKVEEKNKSFSVRKIYDEVTKSVIGQDEAVKTVISTIIRNSFTDVPKARSNMFLIGGTGNGKTETMEQVLKRLEIPYIIEDATKYTEEGYVGDKVENALVRLIGAANGDITKAQRGVIILDEMDKKGDNRGNSHVSTTAVQEGLLKMLEGSTFSTTRGRFSTEFVTFVLSGACEETFKARDKRLKKKINIRF